MIRFTPTTEKGKGFDPIASALTAAAPVLRAAGAISAKYEVSGKQGDYPVDGSFAATFDAGTCKALAASPDFTITLKVQTKAGELPYQIHVINDLICVPSAPASVDGLTNGDFGNQELCYPEALNPAKTRSKITRENDWDGKIAMGGRPYYAIVVTDITGDSITCHGPTYKIEQGKYLGTEDNAVGKIRIFCTDPNLITSEENIDVETPVIEAKGSLFNFVSDEFGSVPIVFTQAAQFIDGRILDYTDYLKALQIVCFIERDLRYHDMGKYSCPFLQGGVYNIPVMKRGGRWYLTPTGINFWADYCAENGWIKTLFTHISATSTEMFLCDSDGEKLGSITKHQGSQSCYALSYAYIFALARGGYLSDAIAGLASAVDAGGALTTDGKYIKANSGTWGSFVARDAMGSSFRLYKNGFGKLGPGNKRGESYISEFTIESLKKVIGENGVFILGYDPDSSKPANSRSDHFIVARLVGNRIIVEFDPYRVEGSVTYSIPGTDVTASADSWHEACVHYFKEVDDGRNDGSSK